MSTYHHGDLRRALLDEASAVLEAEGPQAVTFRGLARRLGVSHAAPGYHFADRDALLIELAAVGHDLLADAMERRLARSGDDPLAAIGLGYLDFALSHPQRFRLMFAGLVGVDCGASPAFVAASNRSGALLVRVASGTDDPATDPTAWLRAWALVHGLATLWIDGTLGRGFDDLGGARGYRRIADRIVTGD